MSNKKTISDYAKQLNQSEDIQMLSSAEAKNIIDVLFRMIKDDLNNGDNVRINNFGTFKLKTRPARKGRNPQTGETIDIYEKQVITFKQSKIAK